MIDLVAELSANYNKFRQELRAKFSTTDKALDPKGWLFREAYSRLATINSWRADVIAKISPDEVSEFILEAQNDGLCSLAFATVGAWRVALQSLRSMIENTLAGLYFADHRIEYQLWMSGGFKIGFSPLLDYFASHPLNAKLPSNIDPIPALRREYATLSMSVHGRAPFRMTKGALSTVVCDSSPVRRGAYLTRQREVIRSICLLKLMLFATELTGTKQQELRKLLTAQLPPKVRQSVRGRYKVIV
jgi:hypothetical protein